MVIEDPRTFTNAALAERLKTFQQRAFEIYETAAERAESEPAHRDAYYAQAEDDVAPLLTDSKRFNDEHVCRLRRRARRWWHAAVATVVVGLATLAWLATHGALR